MKNALVASDSNVAKDPRVLKQIRWLIEEGWTVDSLGRGDSPEQGNGTHYQMPLRPFPLRVLANLLLPNKARYRFLVGSGIPDRIHNHTGEPKYDLVIINEIELLPWYTRRLTTLVRPGTEGHTHLDLHEYSPSQRRGIVFMLAFHRYRHWLTSFIPSPVFDTRSVVADGIADLYTQLFSIPKPAVVRNCPDYVDLEPTEVDPQDIRLAHHGSAASARGLQSLIQAMKYIEDRFSLHLMLVGSPKVIANLKRRAKPFGGRVVFHEPVGVNQVSRALNDFDLEVIFYPPVTENMRYSLPNKLFEAIQGRLGLVIGESPEMAALVSSAGNGIIVSGWSGGDLARTINGLSASQVSDMKHHSAQSAVVLSSQHEKNYFLSALGMR